MFRVLARGSAAVALAASMAVVVPTSATALATPTGWGAAIIGSVRAAAPGVARVAVGGALGITPVGWGIIGATIAGQILYSTSDTWIPWVAGQFGEGGDQSATSEGDNVPVFLSVAVDPAPGGVFAVTGVASATANFFSGGVDYQCKLNGVVGPLTSVQFPWDNFASGQSRTWSSQCAGGAALTFLQTRHWGYPHWSASNQVQWGEAFNAQTGASYRFEVDCRLADGSLQTLVRTTDNPQGGGLLVGSCEAAFPGSHGVAIRLLAGATGAPMVEQWSQTWDETSVAYPNCVGAGIACSYVLEYQGVPCVAGQTPCINWALKATAAPADYQCKYGEYSLSLSGCGILERAYEPNGTVLTQKNTDGNPLTADVTTPEWLPQPEPQPQPIPEGAPGGAPAQIPSGTPLAPPSPTPIPTTTQGCWATGGSLWNPVDWVLRPVQCALSWAFVPSAAGINTQQIKDQIDRAGIGPSIAALTTAVTSLGGSEGGCTGPTMDFTIGSVHQDIQPFNACAAPMSTIAGYAYAFISVITVVGGAAKIVSLIAHGFGYGAPPPTWEQGTLF